MVGSRYNVRHKFVSVSLHVRELFLYGVELLGVRIFRSRKLTHEAVVTFVSLTAVLFNMHDFWDVITKIQLPDVLTASHKRIPEHKSTVVLYRERKNKINGTYSTENQKKILKKLHPKTLYFFRKKYILRFFFLVALRPYAVHDLLILEVSRSHTTTHHIR